MAAAKQMKPTSPDVYSYVSQSEHFAVDAAREAELAIIAGADTNAITISNACQLLCRYPAYQSTLHDELKDLPARNGIVDDKHLVGPALLMSSINETLRLFPPVPSGLQRVTPPEGANVVGRFIPGNMIISTPTYAIQRGKIYEFSQRGYGSNNDRSACLCAARRLHP
jgi:cytochrome P450